MKILVLYIFCERKSKIRKTIIDHLYSFKNYIVGVDFHYCNVLGKIPNYLRLVNYDAVILHYSFLSAKWDPELWQRILPGFRLLKQMDCPKVAIPQDEYVYTDAICEFFREHGVETVFTCATSEDYQILYPREKSGLKHYFTTFTGFVDEMTLERLEELSKKVKKREIDIGYRARDLPFWLGHFGQVKKKIAEPFLALKEKVTLKMDVSTRYEDVFYGDDWFRFILSCRTMLGCLGGASMLDSDGSIRNQVEAYVEHHPDASFAEVEEYCFKGKDDTLKLFALSPRHFECAMAKTCQVLLEGNYLGVFKPGVHYIELKKDLSNLDQVIEQVQDEGLCKNIAERAYEDVVVSGKYTYRRFADQVIDHIRIVSSRKRSSFLNNQLFRIVSIFLGTRRLFNPIHRFFFLPKPFYRLIVAIMPDKMREKLKPIKHYFFCKGKTHVSN